MKFYLFPLLLFLGALPKQAYAYGSIACGYMPDGKAVCKVATKDITAIAASKTALILCNLDHLNGCMAVGPTDSFANSCKSVAVPSNGHPWYSSPGSSFENARSGAISYCATQNSSCETLVTACDFPNPILSPASWFSALFTGNLSALGAGVLFGVGVAIALFTFALRARITNFVIHGSLPLKLPVYGEDIQCLFRRTQRLNWYGRVLFGIVVNLSMTHQQFIDLRKYWLARVIAFDSLRRQRQNELARMHLQLAATAKPPLKEKTALRQLWAAIKYLFFVIFYLIRALFSFLFGFLFIRVTVAKLARGTHIESTDLVLILQAKQAIEDSAKYLKEYLETANTFDGRDEVSDAG